MNPDKMRSEYGKLVYLLMDAADPSIKALLEFDAIRPLKTVYSLLEERGGLAMLSDPLMARATQEIVSMGRSRYDIQKDIKDKERSRDVLARRFVILLKAFAKDLFAHKTLVSPPCRLENSYMSQAPKSPDNVPNTTVL